MTTSLNIRPAHLLNAPLAVRPLQGLAWICIFGALLVAASPETGRSWLTLATGAGFQLLATSIFAGLASLWRGPFTQWWRIAAAASVAPAVVLAACVVLPFTPEWLQLAAQGGAAALVLLYTYQGHSWRGALVAAGALLVMRGIMMSIFYSYWMFVLLQV